jgi:hypothetical protein
MSAGLLKSDAFSDLRDCYCIAWVLSLPEADAPPRSLLDKLKFEASSPTAVLSHGCLESDLLSNTI